MRVKIGATIKIVFVCTGNICRSPYAEFVARNLIGDAGVEFTSAGTMARSGNPATSNGAAVAGELGVDLTPHQATLLTAEVVAEADLIYAMEDEHVEAVLRLDPKANVALLRPDGLGIPDPYGQDRQTYLDVYGVVNEALRQRLENLKFDRSSASEKP